MFPDTYSTHRQVHMVVFVSVSLPHIKYWPCDPGIPYSPTASPGSQLTVWTSSLPWWRTTQLGSFWEVPLGSRGIIWNLRKSVSLISTFSGQMSRMSGIVSWSKSSLQASPRPSPMVKKGKGLWNSEMPLWVSKFTVLSKLTFSYFISPSAFSFFSFP